MTSVKEDIIRREEILARQRLASHDGPPPLVAVQQADHHGMRGNGQGMPKMVLSQSNINSAETDESAFLEPLSIVVWNMTNAEGEPQREKLVGAIRYLFVSRAPDVLILQECNSDEVKQYVSILAQASGGDASSYAIRCGPRITKQPFVQHIFAINVNTISVPELESPNFRISFAHDTGFKGSYDGGGSLCLWHKNSGTRFFLTSLHTSKTLPKEDRLRAFTRFVSEYTTRMKTRYKEERPYPANFSEGMMYKDDDHLSVVMGELNFNPFNALMENDRVDFLENWTVLGKADSHSGPGVFTNDYFLVKRNSMVRNHVQLSSTTIPLKAPANQTLPAKGLSEHDPMHLTVTFLRKQ